MTGCLAILASGTGSNAAELIAATRDGRVDAEVVCVVCDRPGAPVVQRSRSLGAHVIELAPSSFASPADFEGELVTQLLARGVEHVVLAGYMRICGRTFLAEFAGRTINVHPSLLPLFPGRDAIGDALSAGVAETGVTVHFIDEGVDTGPIICQMPVPVLAADTRQTLGERLHRVEHMLLPVAVDALVRGHARLEEGRARLSPRFRQALSLLGATTPATHNEGVPA